MGNNNIIPAEYLENIKTEVEQGINSEEKEDSKKEIKGKKFDANKPNLALIPKEAMWMMGQAFSYGAKKYGEENHKDGLAIKRQLAAALRHIYQFLDGEDIDPESGLNHLGHALASVAMAAYTLENNKDFDDRYKKEIK